MTSRPPNRQSSIASQRQSTDRRSSLRTSNPDVFSDDFALESLDVADGHNPSSAHAMPAEPSSQPCTTPQRSRSTYTIPEPSLDTSQDKGSQPPDRGGSFTPQHDAPTIQHPQRALSVASGSETSDITSLPQGHLSTSSTFSMPRTQSPYQGATGPSHPYAMYPQDIGMTRTPSVATNSTIGMPDRAYPRTLGPTHPYGMYSQNTVPEGDVSPIAAPNSSIPVGFPGLGQNYQRRLGPDGEDAADIIGPDGHTEQLPPYTRYPDGVLLKDTPPRLANTTNETPDPYTSQDTIQPAHSPVSVTQSHLTEDSGTRLNVPAAIPVARTDESGSFKEKWTKKGKRRMCKGKIPVWVVVIVVILLVLAGALLGGIIGRFIGRRRAQQATGDASPQAIQTTPPDTVTVTTTSLIDATPLPSLPPNLPPLPTGTFGVALSIPLEASHDCLTNPAQISAWDCGWGGFIGVEISKLGNGAHQLELLPGLSSGGPLRYGAQPPPFNEPYDLIVMLDKVEPNRGPAYFFQHSYDKIVVVPEKQLSAGTSKRSLEDSSKLEERDWYHGGIAQPGHRPWFCFWNSTVLEGFVYITQDSSAASSSSVASAASATLSTTTGPPRSPPSTSGTATTTSTAGWKRQYSPAPMPSPMIAPCPKVVKIEERRHSVNAMQPYCQQMQVLNDGSVGTVTGPTGELVTVELNETEPIYQRGVRMSGVIGKRRRWWEESNTGRVEKKDVIANGCQCMWLSE